MKPILPILPVLSILTLLGPLLVESSCAQSPPKVSADSESPAQASTLQPKPEAQDEFSILAERLTKVEIPETRIDKAAAAEQERKGFVQTKAAGLVDRAGKALVEITVDPDKFPTHTIASGDRLYLIARKHYGSGHYGEFLATYNQIDPNKLKIGQAVRIPTIEDAFNAAGLYPVMKAECGAILGVRTDFMQIEPQLRALRGKAIAPETKSTLLELRKRVLTTMNDLLSEKTGIKTPPSSMRIQLRSCAENLNRLAKGSFGGQQIDRVHQRLGFAVAYAIVWARKGFQ